MHATSLLEEFRTGQKGIVHCQLIGTKTEGGDLVKFDREGDKYRAGLGDAIIKLNELIAERKRRSRWWYIFFNGRFSCIELDISIKRLTDCMNYVHLDWTE